MSRTASTPPSTPTERRLAAAWSTVLGVPGDQIGRRDHFFDRGGTSLSAVKLAIALDRVVSLKDVTRHPVLADLAQLLDRRSGRDATESPARTSSSNRKDTEMSSSSPASPPGVELCPGKPPLLRIEAAGDALNWVAEHAEALRAAVAEHGAVLVRGLGLRHAAEVRAVFERLATG